MQLRHIEVFHAILQSGTLTGAAKLLNISQPAATKLLQHAERRIGFPLFLRVNGRLRLTREGALLRHRVEHISDELRDLQRLVQNACDPERSPLRVVSTPTLATALVPRAVSRIRAAFPDTQIDLMTQHSREMLDSILLRDTDIGLTLQEVLHPGVEQEKIREGSLMVIAPSGWWRTQDLRKPIGLDELAGQPMVGIAVKDMLGMRLRTSLQYLSPQPKIVTWVQTYQLARALVSDRHGIALVDPFTALDRLDDAIQVRPLEPALEAPLYVLYRNDTTLSAVQKKFIQHLRSLCKPVLTSSSAAAYAGRSHPPITASYGLS